MIENFNEIGNFIPSFYKTLNRKEQEDLFQSFIDFLSNKFNIQDKYILLAFN